MKKCVICKNHKDIHSFYKDKSRHDGLSYTCKFCSKERRRNHYLQNKERVLSKNKEWKIKNKDRYRIKERESERIRYRTDIAFRIRKCIRHRVWEALNGKYKSGSAIKDMGCTVHELTLHLESKFKKNMTWSNYGQWHIDHIVPLSKFDLTNREEFLKACHYTNLQPLWAIDNIKKGNK